MNRPLSDAENMTLREYSLKSEACALRDEDKAREIHQQAWANLVVKNMKGQGSNARPAFHRFDEFYNSDKERDRIRAFFEPDFKPVEKPKVREQTAGERRIQRMIQYEEQQES